MTIRLSTTQKFSVSPDSGLPAVFDTSLLDCLWSPLAYEPFGKWRKQPPTKATAPHLLPKAGPHGDLQFPSELGLELCRPCVYVILLFPHGFIIP